MAGILLSLSSCVSTKNTVYFTDIPTDSPWVKLASYHEPLIQTDDILHITIQTIGGEITSSINQLSGSPLKAGSLAASGGGETPSGYLVDKDGQVAIPILGTLKLAGLTTPAARKLIRKTASKYFNDPTVQVGFANFKITILGEVAQPNTYTVPNEKVTLLDALGMAGDLTIHGKRENVLLIRHNNGKREFVRFNLNSYETFKSSYFYLKQNDIIYVEPGKGKVASTDISRTQTISILASVATIVTVIISRFL